MRPAAGHCGLVGARVQEPIRVVAVDDHPLLLAGMMSVLSRETDVSIEWLGAARSVGEFHELIAPGSLPAEPDIALVDLRLGDGDSSTDIISDLASRGIRSIVVTAEVRAIPLRRSVQAGAKALVLKSEPAEHIAQVVRRVYSGEDVVTGDIAAALLEHDGLVVDLTARELEIMHLLADGLPRKMIGRYIGDGIAESTVTTHLNRVLTKYRAQDREVGNTIGLLRELRRDGHLSDEGRGPALD